MSDYLDDESRIACCQICTLADAMRVCNECPFSIGLPFRSIRQNEELSADCLLRIEELRETFLQNIYQNLYHDIKECVS